MQPGCTEMMKTARELLEHGVLAEGAEKLSELHDCGRRVGCTHWNRCMLQVEGQWKPSKVTPKTGTPRS